MLRDFEREGRGYQCAAVCSMQSLRSTNVQNAVDGFAESELQFDLIVIDEAHYMRNVDTKTHQLGKALSAIADNFLLLTATPLQLKREDLFRLLNLLDPDEYDNHALFESRTEANKPVVLAQNALRRIPADVQAAPWAPWEIQRADLDAEPVRGIIEHLHKTGTLVLKGIVSENQRELFLENQ